MVETKKLNPEKRRDFSSVSQRVTESQDQNSGFQTVFSLGGLGPGLTCLPSLQAPRPSICSWACTLTSAATTPAPRPLRRSSFLTATTITKASTGEWVFLSAVGQDGRHGGCQGGGLLRPQQEAAGACSHAASSCKQGQSAVTLES